MNRFPPTVPLMCVLLCSTALAQDWLGFRGPGRRGIAASSKRILKWNESTNLKWTAELPGQGSSSPIIWGDRIFVLEVLVTATSRCGNLSA